MLSLALSLALAAPPAAPAVDWARFPEGATLLQSERVNNKRGTTTRRTFVVTRTGPRTVIEVETMQHDWSRRAPPTTTTRRFESAEPGAAAVSAEGDPLDWRCESKRVVIHSPDLSWRMDVPSCEGEYATAYSRKPQRLPVLVCTVEGAPATFLPGKSIEHVWVDNDCTLHEGLRFPEPTSDAGVPGK